MRWVNTPPDQPGWYWADGKKDTDVLVPGVQIVKVIPSGKEDKTLWALCSGDMFLCGLDQFARWSNEPIKEPGR